MNISQIFKGIYDRETGITLIMAVKLTVDLNDKKNITQPDASGYQVRIVRNGKEYSKYFSHNLWGGKKKSLAAAQSWRDQKITHLDSIHGNIIGKPALSNNRSTGVRGVTKRIHHDKRRNTKSLVYQVHWIDNGKIKNKKFLAGRIETVTADQDLHTFRTAIHFRKEYELCRNYNKKFDPSRYATWRTERIYDSHKKTG